MSAVQNSQEITPLLRLYRIAASALRPLFPLWVNRRARAGKEDSHRKTERYGIPSLARPKGPLVWMHGASVGECTMLLPLISRFKDMRPDITVLLTSGTVTAAKLMADRLPEGALHQYIPLDSPQYVKKFLAHWQADVAVWAESEIWPNLIMGARARGTRLALVNARMSEKSLKGWRKRKASAAAVFSSFSLILAADKQTAEGLSGFTPDTVEVIGNLKDAALPLPALQKKLSALERAIGARPVWCAASTHGGEDDIVLRAHLEILKQHPRALLILAPRHPERRDEISELINSMGLSFSVRSSGHKIDDATQIYVFDSIGEMGLAYRIAPITLMCGSLSAGLSGHNPLEPARLGSAVLSGPFVSSFAEVYADMQAAKTVTSPKDISAEISRLFSDKSALAKAQDEARAFCSSRADVLSRVWDALLPLLPAKAAP